MGKKPDYDGSTVLESVQHEIFVSSLLAGITQREAYRNAGYKVSDEQLDSAASRLSSNVKIEARLAYRRAQLAEKCDITEETQIRRFQELSRVSQGLKQMSPAVNAEKEVAMICGLYERDNKQKQGKTVVEILAIVANARHKAITSTQSPIGALNSASVPIEQSQGDEQPEASTGDDTGTCKRTVDN